MTAYARMTWGLSLLTLLTLSLSFAAISAILDRYQERQLDSALLDVARAEAKEAAGNHFSFTDGPGPAANDVGPLDKYGIIFDEQGRVLAATQPFNVGTPRREDLKAVIDVPFDFSFAGGRYRGVETRIPGFPRHRLLLAASREDLDGDSRFVRKAMAIALVVSALCLLAAIGWLVRRTMREHNRIAETLHRIARGETGARVPVEVSDAELRRVGSDIDEIAGRLASLVGNQRRFIAHAAHELRSPLAALHGEIQHAMRKERSAEEYKRSYEFLLKASGRLKHLADQLLDLARAEERSTPAGPAPLDVAIREAIESLQPLAREKGVDIQCASLACDVVAAPSDLERIVRNLLDNAIRHSPSRGVIRVDAKIAETVCLRVRDEGPGVQALERECVFEPFNRSSTARSQAEGAGLGLSIARELARKHGGDVTIAPTAESCFVLTMRTELTSGGRSC
jgi:two-component system, OmpR family, sensor kinase